MEKFESGDIIVPREKLKVWMDWALRVDSFVDGELVAYTLGGGLGYAFDLMAQIRNDFVKVPKKLQHNLDWRSAQFYLGDDPDEWGGTYRAWTSGQRWNGWARPHFEFEEAMRFADASPDEAKTTYDSARDAFVTVIEGNDELYVDEGTIIIVRGRGPLVVYPVGAGNWTWQEYKEKQEDEDVDESSLDGRRRKRKKA